MIFFIIILLIVVFSQAKFADEGGFFEDYLDKKNTTAINGIFVILIIFSHYSQYTSFDGFYDLPYVCLQEHLNQMVVVTFLFYSGYGMMEAVKRSGERYVLKVPSKFIKLLVRFDIAVLIFLIVGKGFLNLELDYSAKNIILSLLSWTNIGNSNWYITAILGLYIAFFISFIPLLIRNNIQIRWVCSILFLALSILFVYMQIHLNRPWYCYDTIVLMPVGVFYSLLKEKLNKVFMYNNYIYTLCALIALGAYIFFYFRRYDGIETFSLWGIAFMALVLLFTMKVSVFNSLLEWFGVHIFSIYILQRLPMTILDYYGCIESHRYISLVIAIMATAFIAMVFDYFVDKLLACVEQRIRKNKLEQAAI